MRIIFFILTLFVLLKSIGYSLYEWKENKNKLASITIIVLTLLSVFAVNFLVSFIY